MGDRFLGLCERPRLRARSEIRKVYSRSKGRLGEAVERPTNGFTPDLDLIAGRYLAEAGTTVKNTNDAARRSRIILDVMARKSRFVIGVGLMAAAIGYLIFAAVRNTAEYYLTVNELNQRKAELSGQMIRVAGRVQPGNISWDPNSLTLIFAIAQLPPDPNQPAITQVVAKDAAVAWRVVARGQPKPDMFAAGRDVIIEGRLAADNTIEATQVLTSCPSKYVPKTPQ